MLSVILALPAFQATASPPVVEYRDAFADAVIRPTDSGLLGLVDAASHRPVDLRRMRIGAWLPNPESDSLFDGEFVEDGVYFRLELEFAGVICPPGPNEPSNFHPFRFGENPVFGFVEIDVDDDAETGGELNRPDLRYLGNVARFGGLPADSEYEDRVALDSSAFDVDFGTPPFVERHGEEFHVALLGSEVVRYVQEVSGDGDGTFEAGETWDVFGRALHRAHGFEEFSLLKQFIPDSVLRFEHLLDGDATRVSLVFALIEAAIPGDSQDPCDAMEAFDAQSVLAALDDLVVSAQLIKSGSTGFPEEELILGWADKKACEFLEPVEWRITALLGTSYVTPVPGPERFVWTDVYPEVVRGDGNGDKQADADDADAIASFVEQADATDGVVDGSVQISNFAWNFSLFDLNYDGVVDQADEALVFVDGDVNEDGLAGLADFAILQVCFSGDGIPFAEERCAFLDFDADGDIDGDDFRGFVVASTRHDDD